VIEDVVIKEKFDSILCIGAPTIFERFYSSKKGLNLFMLDFDHRFVSIEKKRYGKASIFRPNSTQNLSLLTIVCWSTILMMKIRKAVSTNFWLKPKIWS
jgi:hypothetical protein